MAKENNVPLRRTTIHDIPDDTLEIILKRITSLSALFRAAATCKLWRRVIGDAGFLSRFRHHSSPHILGHYRYSERGNTEFFPYPAPAGEIAIDDDTVSDRTCLYFLTTSYSNLNSAELHDSLGGLLAFHCFGRLISIIVCNPWTRQHREIYPPMLPRANTYPLLFGIFLLDSSDLGETGTELNMSNFRVLCLRLVRCIHDDDGMTTVEASIFSARDEHWLTMSTMSIGDDIVPGVDFFDFDPQSFVLVGHAGGSICWSTGSSNAVLHLDESTGEFSLFTLPVPAGVKRTTISYNTTNLRVIGGDAGTVHLVRIVGSDLEVLRYARGTGGECTVERRVCVPRLWCFLDRADWVVAHRSIALCDVLCDAEFISKFAADVKNLKLGHVQKRSHHSGRSLPYELPWTISVCL
ncbi:unnamed protein product [Urochloa decumbens]|uniref:F-box domain-containing protein n=1 Tax=Urochloa decumbens TaxID=240449 RepID=A0ABC8VXS5_9POAL